MIGFSIGAEFTVTGLERKQMEQLFELLGSALMERQAENSKVLDHSVSIDLGEGLVEISITTAGDTREEAEALAEETISRVLRKTGGKEVDVAMAALRADLDEEGAHYVARELVAL